MIPLRDIKEGQRRVRELANRLMHLDKRFEKDIIVNTLNFYGYTKHIFKISCQHNLLYEKSVECIYSPMDRKWYFYDPETGNKINKSITQIFNSFVKECKKRSIR